MGAASGPAAITTAWAGPPLPAFTTVPTECDEGEMVLRRASPGQPVAVLVCVDDTADVKGKCIEEAAVTHVHCAHKDECHGRLLGYPQVYDQCYWTYSPDAVWCETSSHECIVYEHQTVVKTKWVTMYAAAK